MDLVGRVAKVAEVADRVIDIVAEQLGVDKDKVNPETHFVNDLGADSLDTVELVMELEEEFDIDIPEDAAEKIQTVGQAIEFDQVGQGIVTPIRVCSVRSYAELGDGDCCWATFAKSLATPAKSPARDPVERLRSRLPDRRSRTGPLPNCRHCMARDRPSGRSRRGRSCRARTQGG